ncbi:hypothetical protein ACFXG4_12290 [Nocardia sp. NPDC059246]|uniref:hypothetical protein n=1 Tax=unclassified Nocardia TaxID=2637762 RepID=UPI0036D16F2F
MASMDLSSPFVILGAVCIVAAIVGGGVKALVGEFPIISTIKRQVALLMVGIVFVVLPQIALYLGHFRVTSVQVSWDGNYYEGCDVDAAYTVFVKTAGASGDYEIRVVIDDHEIGSKTSTASFPGVHTLHGRYTETASSTGDSESSIYVDVLSPKSLTSDKDILHITC